MIGKNLKPGMKACVFAVLIGVGAAGCRSVNVRIAEDATQRASGTVAVFPLDDRRAENVATDFTVYGRTGGQGSGPVVSRQISRAFESCSDWRSVAQSDMTRMMREERLSLRDLAALDPDRACVLARRLKADVVVMGRVLTYRTSWFLFVPRSKVFFEARGLDTETCKEIWAATAGDSSFFRTESEIVDDLAERIVGGIQSQLRRTGK